MSSQGSFKENEGSGTEARIRGRFEDAILLALKTEEGAMSQGMLGTSKKKKEESIFS